MQDSDTQTPVSQTSFSFYRCISSPGKKLQVLWYNENVNIGIILYYINYTHQIEIGVCQTVEKHPSGVYSGMN